MKIVLDTNVVISGYLSPHGTPGEILSRVASDELTLCYDARMIAEYDDVLHRPEFDIPEESSRSFLDQLKRNGEMVAAALLSKPLPDPDDAPFLEVALAAQALLVTGNIKHYPASYREGVSVLTPADFLRLLREQQY
jgi:putative PIN family toxin of toxin-antitoxin system